MTEKKYELNNIIITTTNDNKSIYKDRKPTSLVYYQLAEDGAKEGDLVVNVDHRRTVMHWKMHTTIMNTTASAPPRTVRREETACPTPTWGPGETDGEKDWLEATDKFEALTLG